MAFALTWKIEFGDVLSTSNITSFVEDISIDSSAEIGKCGRSTCSITINNVGGQFTPEGTGTYSSTDWFAQALIVTCDTPLTSQLAFVGMIDSFVINHTNRLESSVTITALDILTFASTSPVFTPSFTSSSTNITDWLDSVFYDLGTPGYRFIRLPAMGTQPSYVDAVAITSTTNRTSIDTNKLVTTSRVGDWLNTQIFPSGPATAFVTGYGTSFGVWFWLVYVVDRELNRTSAYAQTFVFVDGSSALTSGQMPFRSIEVGFQNDELINTSEINDNGGLIGTSTSDFNSIFKYGFNAYSATQTAPANQADLDYASQFWGNRYGSVRYRAEGLALTFSQVRALSVDNGNANTAFAQLCSQAQSLWNRATVTYRAPGMSSSKTEQLVITRRRIMASPSDTRIELEFVSGVDNQSFELNSSTYGILDTNRLG